MRPLSHCYVLTCGVSLLALACADASAREVITIPNIVSAARSPVPLSKVASSVTVIDEQQIKRQNKATVSELLRQVPGVTLATNGTSGQTTRVFMRGTNSNHVLVMIDGMMVNDPSDPGNAFDFSNLTTESVERIEVLRGPQSTLYGSQAIGGVINIITKKGEGAPTSSAYAEYGSYNTNRIGANSSGRIGNTSYSFGLSQYHTSGISALAKKAGGIERDASDMYTLSLNLESQLSDNFTAKGNFRYNRNNTEFDSPGGFTRPADDPDPVNDSRQFNGRVAGELSLYDGVWTQELGYSLLDLNRSQITEYFDAMFMAHFGRQNYQGRRDTFDWIHRIRPDEDHLLTIGTETWDESFKTDTISTVDVRNHAVFADHQFNIGDSFFMNNGVRLDFHETFGRQFTWKVAPGYLIEQTGTRLKTSYGTGFKAPSLSQLYDPSSGNLNLNPETSKGWDAGFEQTLFDDKVTFGATYFKNHLTQLISFSPAPPFVGLNIGKARTEGVESTLSIRPVEEWTISASHVYTLSQDRSSNQELLRRPKHQANLSTMYDYSEQGDVGMNVRYSSQRRDIDINFPFGRVDVKSFTTVDVFTNYEVKPGVTVYGRADNLLDKEYEEVFSYGTLGRTFYVGVKSSF